MTVSTEEELAKQLLQALEETRRLQELHDQLIAKFDALVDTAKEAVLDVEDIRFDITRLGLNADLADSFDTAAHRVQATANLAKVLSNKANDIAQDLEAAKKRESRLRDELFAFHARETDRKEYERRKKSIDRAWEELDDIFKAREKRTRGRRYREYVERYCEEDHDHFQRRAAEKAAHDRFEAHARAEARRKTAEAKEKFEGRWGPDPREKYAESKPKQSQDWKKPEKTIEEWRKDVEYAFQDYSSIGDDVPFPLPPAWGRCAKAACTTIGGGGWGEPVCKCQVQYAFYQSGVKLKTERLRWHPDRFSVCSKEVGAMAEEVFKIVNEMYEKQRR